MSEVSKTRDRILEQLVSVKTAAVMIGQSTDDPIERQIAWNETQTELVQQYCAAYVRSQGV